VRVQPTMAQLEKDYAGKVNFVHMNYIVHPTAKPAHVATECAGDQGKYWEMHNQIFATQKTDAASLRTMAQGFGIDMAKYDACLLAGKDATLGAQQAVGSSIGVSGTPSFVIGVRSGTKVSGQMVVGAQDISAFRTAIDAQLKN
jgi:protein-disulfide isomerase